MLRISSTLLRFCYQSHFSPSLRALAIQANPSSDEAAKHPSTDMRFKRAWKSGEGARLPSWLHIIIRKRE